jgi:hypothetical protein
MLADLPNDWFAKIKMLLWRIVDKTDGERCSDLTHRYFRPERRLRCQAEFLWVIRANFGGTALRYTRRKR